MRKLLISAATLAFLAAPALAQPEEPGSRGKAAMGHQQEPHAAPAGPRAAPQAAPAQAAPQNRGGGDRGARGDHGNRGPAQAAPVAQPQAAQPQTRGNDFGGNRSPGNDNRPALGGTRPGYNGADNRPANGFANRPGNNGAGNRPGMGGSRQDFSSFRDFHRSFSSPNRFHAPSYRRPQGWYSRRWSYGEVLPSLFWGQQYWLSNYMAYDLPPPPPGTVWVRYGNDALLIDRYSGEIITVEYSVFY